jgi:hypothetical protein
MITMRSIVRRRALNHARGCGRCWMVASRALAVFPLAHRPAALPREAGFCIHEQAPYWKGSLVHSALQPRYAQSRGLGLWAGYHPHEPSARERNLTTGPSARHLRA